MKNNLNNKLLIIILCFTIIMTMNSCAKGIKFYNQTNQDTYFNLFYEQINDPNEQYVAFDLRKTSSYEECHIRQFQNYDLCNKSLSDFLMYLKTNYGYKVRIYIYTPQELEYQEIMRINREYQEIYLLTSLYEDLNQELIKELFILDTGPYDCGC